MTENDDIKKRKPASRIPQRIAFIVLIVSVIVFTSSTPYVMNLYMEFLKNN